MPTTNSSLFLNALQLNVYLGLSNKERLKKQIVWLDIAIAFHKKPKACDTDNIHDTICYADLIDLISKKIANKKFRLIEHLAAIIYQIIKTSLSKKAQVSVSITKYPSIKNLTGGATFVYGDQP